LAVAECALRQPDSADVCKRAMEHYSIIDQPAIDPSLSKASKLGPPLPGGEPELAAELESELAHGSANRGLNPSVSAGIAAANALAAAGLAGDAIRHAGPRLPGEDGGHSLAEMAERDLDAALQLLAERAQYITGAAGAAIALRRDDGKAMVCRASAGTKAPELGALLSTQSGLSGESLRTRLPLRCDDAEHDPRVNPESCRELGIASVMIVPVLGDELRGLNLSSQNLSQNQALGVFELFSSHACAFGERDLSALQRLGEMVETAVRLARAAQIAPVDAAEDSTEGNAEITTEGTGEHRGSTVPESSVLDDAVLDDEPVLEVEMEDFAAELRQEAAVEEAVPEVAVTAPPKVESTSSAPAAIPAAQTGPAAIFPAVAKEQPAKRPLMWSAAVHGSPDAPKPAEADQSHVPPMLRNLRKCKACGFPVSEGRTLCVECDEKQWRGQLRMPLPTAPAKAGPAVDFRQRGEDAGLLKASSARAGAAQGAAMSAAAPASVISVLPTSAVPTPVASQAATLAPIAPAAIALTEPTSSPVAQPSQGIAVQAAIPRPEVPILSGGLGQESWLGANKYILGAILLIAAVVGAIVWLR
jgi:hypothetical protein